MLVFFDIAVQKGFHTLGRRKRGWGSGPCLSLAWRPETARLRSSCLPQSDCFLALVPGFDSFASAGRAVDPRTDLFLKLTSYLSDQRTSGKRQDSAIAFKCPSVLLAWASTLATVVPPGRNC